MAEEEGEEAAARLATADPPPLPPKSSWTGGAAVEALISIEPRVRTCMPELTGPARRLGEWLAEDNFPTVRKAIAQRVLTELNGVRRLKPNDAEAEIEYLRALAMSLTAAAGRILRNTGAARIDPAAGTLFGMSS